MCFFWFIEEALFPGKSDLAILVCTSSGPDKNKIIMKICKICFHKVLNSEITLQERWLPKCLSMACFCVTLTQSSSVEFVLLEVTV